ncbi:MAG: hypothetical protein D3913_10895 [Candidatus Electrothrix sp. LOE1_4_5]|nr:hypothetical protein [Candidatus Electrothrix gigas]
MRLDKQNPRLPEDMLNKSQSSMIHYMIDKFRIIDIAKSIAKNGFFINEFPIVTKENRYFVVVEGNRRLTALKLLRNPDLAPPRKRATYARLAENIDIANYEKLKFYIAPSKEAVAPILIARHGSEMTSGWQRIMKMRFLAGDVLKGIDHEEIAERYSVPTSEVKTAAITILLREMIRFSDISDTEKDVYLSENFQTSTLTRFVQAKAFMDRTGLSLVGAKLCYSLPEEEFKALIFKICQDINNDRVKSHIAGPDRKDYLNEVLDSVLSGKTEENEFVADPVPEPAEKKEPRKPRTRKKPERLIPESMNYQTGNQKLNDLIKEGQKMTVGSYVYSGGLLLRTILDLTVQRLYDINDKLDETKKQNGRTHDLSKRLKDIYNRHGDWLPDQATCKKLERFTSGGNNAYIHLDTLNDYVHGEYGRPTKDDLRSFWSQISPLVDLILEED